MNVKEYKNPIYEMYVAPYNHHFERNSQNIGRIIWAKNVEGITIEKD